MNNLVITATASMVLVCVSAVPVPAFGADTKQTPSVSEAKGCKDLREAMVPLLRSRKELTEATERVEGDENQTAIQGIRDRVEESVKQTNLIMDKLQCVKNTKQLPSPQSNN